MVIFNADEVFEIAVQIERNGANFYRKAAEPAEGGSRDLLLRLAEMEDDHKKTFTAMQADLGAAEKRPVTFDPNNQAVLYLQAMAYGKVFSADPSEGLTGNEPMEEILNTAIGLEKDSIVYYEGMKAVVPATAGKEQVEAIIQQELGHIVDLTKQIEALKA